MKNRIAAVAFSALLSLSTSSAMAGVIASVWNGWTQIAAEDQEGSFNYVNPGWGGQKFDAEYLYFQQQGNQLSLGLQTGFDVVDGHQLYNNENYWAGEMVLTFGSQTFAIDFGLGQCGYSQRNNAACGTNNSQGLNAAAGVYGNVVWNNDIYFTNSGPFAMSTGDLLSAVTTQAGSATVNGQKSYYRTVSFDLSALGPLSTNDFDLRWTMSCGNDLISGNGTVTDVPEPGALLLLALGLIGLGLARSRAHA